MFLREDLSLVHMLVALCVCVCVGGGGGGAGGAFSVTPTSL